MYMAKNAFSFPYKCSYLQLFKLETADKLWTLTTFKEYVLYLEGLFDIIWFSAKYDSVCLIIALSLSYDYLKQGFAVCYVDG